MSSEKVDNAGTKVTESISNAVEAAKEYIQEVLGVAETKAESIKDEATVVVDEAVDKTEQALDAAKAQTDELLEKAKQDVGKAGEATEAKMDELKEKLQGGTKTDASAAHTEPAANTNTSEPAK